MSNSHQVDPAIVPFDDQLPDQQLNPDGSYKNPQMPQTFKPDPPTPDGSGSVLTTKQCNALIPKVIA